MGRKIAALALMCFAAIAPMTAAAESHSATMQVSVTVIARAIVTVNQQPLDVIVTSEDVRRGYVQVVTPFLVHVRTNSRNGYLLHMVNTGPQFASAEINSADFTMHVSPESIIARPYLRGGDALDLKVRLMLASGAGEGRYEFPLVVDAAPLS